tara:strand:+ start:92 stop:403 length:312 start_codon:yes stop_codon:yes gene_type:complete
LKSDNFFVCIAFLKHRDEIRYTPYGIPILSARLIHISKKNVSNVTKKLNFELELISVGEIAKEFSKVKIGTRCRFFGFISSKSPQSKNLIFNLTNFEELCDLE